MDLPVHTPGCDHGDLVLSVMVDLEEFGVTIERHLMVRRVLADI